VSTFKLSLPTDIPWRRMCVTKDMLDPYMCDDDRPPRWHSFNHLLRTVPSHAIESSDSLRDRHPIPFPR
jgi:hypothetical protein